MNSKLLLSFVVFLVMLNVYSCVQIVWYDLEYSETKNPLFPFRYKSKKKCLRANWYKFEDTTFRKRDGYFFLGTNNCDDKDSEDNRYAMEFKFYDELETGWWELNKGYKIEGRILNVGITMWLNNKEKDDELFQQESGNFTLTRVYWDDVNERSFFHILDSKNQCLALNVYNDKDVVKFRNCNKKRNDEWDIMELWAIQDYHSDWNEHTKDRLCNFRC
jgi:hypothetical protein